MTKRKAPVVGCAFDPDQRDTRGIISAYVNELEYYRPRGFSALAKEGHKLYNATAHFDAQGKNAHPAKYAGIGFDDIGQHVSEWQDACDNLLTEYARKVERHEYISFGPFPHGGAIGFMIDTDSAIEDCDLRVEDTGEVPRGFTGLVIHVSDHGNVTAYQYARGKSRELFAIV